jgi:uncharacterized protein YndB with AHSA1/START domain
MRFTVAVALLAAAPAYAQDRIETEADGSRTLVTEAFVPAPPDAVWQAATTAEGWKRWAVPSAWTAPNDPDLLETAYNPNAKPGDANNIQQRFVARLPRRLLVFRTVRTPPDFPHSDAFMRVTQFFEFAPEAGGTRVRLTGVNYPAGAEGDILLGFFKTGNRTTLDSLAQRLALEPLDFLVGHCWKGTLPTGEANVHCFDRVEGKIRDRHEVLREGSKVYGGETIYAWNPEAKQVGYVYKGMGGGEMRGSFHADGADLDFGTTDHVAKDGKRITIATRWVRVADNAYEARDQSPTPHFTHSVRYTRVD